MGVRWKPGISRRVKYYRWKGANLMGGVRTQAWNFGSVIEKERRPQGSL